MIVKIGDVRRLRVGGWVLAIGSPNRSGQRSPPASSAPNGAGTIRHRVAADRRGVNPSNSGGPLVDTRAGGRRELADPGARWAAYIGISFAIPIDGRCIADSCAPAVGSSAATLASSPPTCRADGRYGLSRSAGPHARGYRSSRQVVPDTRSCSRHYGQRRRAGCQQPNRSRARSTCDTRLGGFAPGTAVTLPDQPASWRTSVPCSATLGYRQLRSASPRPRRRDPARRPSHRPESERHENMSAAERQAVGGARGVKVAAVSAGAGRMRRASTSAERQCRVGDVEQFRGDLVTAFDKTRAADHRTARRRDGPYIPAGR